MKLYNFVPLMNFSGNIAKWNKKEGDEIAAGDSIAEIETDKATMDWEAQDDGFVAKILAEEGAKDVSVGSPVIVIVEEEVNCCLINGKTTFVLWIWNRDHNLGTYPFAQLSRLWN